MLREQRRRKQQVADKIGHEEYIYKLNGDAYSGQEEIRVRQQGDYDPRRAAAANNGGHRPPFAVDDDNNNNNNNGGGRRGNARPLNPITGAPAGGGGADNPNGGAALVPVRDNAPPNQNGPYASPYGAPAAYAGAFNNSPALYYPPSGGGGAYVPQSLVPAMPPIAPLNDLPGPLPPVYRPKPPLTFHGNVAPSAAPLLYVPDGYNNNNYSPYGGNGGYREDGARPSTSPTVLPPLSPMRANNNNGGGGGGMPNAQRSPRPSTSGAAAAAAGGGFVVGSSGLSDLEDRHKEKMAARQRAIELQQENARQMLEQHQRKAAEREREIREDREAEDRLRRERDEVARREQAEVDRERREKELKMMGPRAAQEMLEQQRRETEARREAEAAVRRNRGRQQPQQQQPAATPEKAEGLSDEKTETAPPKDSDGQPSNSPPNHNAGGDGDAALPLDQRAPISFSSGLRPFPQQPMQPPGMYPTQQYFANIGLGGAGITPPPPSSSSSAGPSTASPYYAPFMLQRQQRIQLEGDVIHEELRHIALLLEAQQLNNAITHNTPPPPPPQWAMGPQPTSAGGAGTYLTTGMPSPLYHHNSHQQQQQQQQNYNNGGGYRGSPHPPSSGASYSSSLSANANSPYRGLSAGGTMPPPPLATATPHQGGGAAALLSGEGLIGPWPGLFTPPGPPGSHSSSSGQLYPNPIGHTGAGGAAGAGGGGINASGFLSSYRGDGVDSEELAIEPSCFVMPATVPPPPFVPPYALAPSTHHGPSASSSLGDVNDAKHAGPVERPGTGKPRGLSTPQHDEAAVPPVRAEAGGQPSEKPAVAAHAKEALKSSELEPRPLSASASDSSPVRGATPHLTSTEVVDADTSTPSERRTSAQQAAQRQKGDGAAVEPPVVVLTPRGGGKA